MRRLTIIIALIISINQLNANDLVTTIEANINWETPIDRNGDQVFVFENANYDASHRTLPLYIQDIPLNTYGDLSVEFTDVVYEPLEKNSNTDDEFLSNDLEVNTSVGLARRKPIGQFSFIPIRKTLMGYEKVVSFKAKIFIRAKALPVVQSTRTGFNSVLSDGEIYKLAVDKTGIYKVDYNYLKNIGVDVDKIDPREIKVYGNGGGMLPEANSVARVADVEENSIFVSGEGDGSFDAGDYILFYGEAANKWTYDDSDKVFRHEMNLYTTKNHYFIKFSSGNGKRIASRASQSGATYSTTTYNIYQHYEKEELNLLEKYTYATASGKLWVGESFKFTTSRDFQFIVPNLVSSSPLKLSTRTIGRSIGVVSKMNVSVNNNFLYDIEMAAAANHTEGWYARTAERESSFTSNSSNINVNLTFNKPTSNSEGWLDYLTLNARSELIVNNSQFPFRDVGTIGEAVTDFNLTASNASNLKIWDITDPYNIASQEFNTNGNAVTFGAGTNNLKEFIAFDGASYYTPVVVDTVENQNLHGGLSSPDLVIVYHKKFKEQAEKLAAHRASHSNLSVEAVDIEEVYNEFGSGNPDLSALRDFSKYLYEEFSNYRYLLLFGDASYDYKHINTNAPNDNYIPVFETSLSTHPINAYNTDDYFALLDTAEGGNINAGKLDINVGRLPVRTINEATAVVNKIVKYDTDPEMLGDWKNRLTFMADDEDGHTHLNDADAIANATWIANPVKNIDKIYLDAYPQISTHGGDRIPTVTEALHNNMFKGNFTVNYMGHGGEDGLAQERILQIPHIQSWQNTDKLPLFVTATCSFAPFDDPSINSAGEIILLKENGGAIALFTTVRAVFTTSNKQLTSAVFDNLFKKINGQVPTLGDVLAYAKNTSGASTGNSRKFGLLGDPSQTLAHPKYNVLTTKVNGVPISNTDTIRALQQVTIEGYIANEDSSELSSFNGIIYPTVYDKRIVRQTLGHDGSFPKNYDIQKTVLFKGRASVTNGQFKFSFIVPKDINYAFAEGKISYYADDGSSLDAAGYHNGIVIGGTNADAVNDDNPPVVQVYMNNDEFVFGGMTDKSPTLYVKLEDDFGINTTGTGIGHDLTGVLNENTSSTYVLNDFYESELDNFKKGEVRYPLSSLEEGRHAIKVKAWDISNNSGEGYTEFVVASNAGIALDHVLNYPNPFTTSTEFQFEHNLANQPMTVQVQIFTVSGRLVKTIQENVQPDGYRVTGIEWDGTDDFGNRIGRGVYVYKVSVGTETGDGILASASQFEKLVILK
jgi:hypothetical protein